MVSYGEGGMLGGSSLPILVTRFVSNCICHNYSFVNHHLYRILVCGSSNHKYLCLYFREFVYCRFTIVNVYGYWIQFPGLLYVLENCKIEIHKLVVFYNICQAIFLFVYIFPLSAMMSIILSHLLAPQLICVCQVES